MSPHQHNSNNNRTDPAGLPDELGVGVLEQCSDRSVIRLQRPRRHHVQAALQVTVADDPCPASKVLTTPQLCDSLHGVCAGRRAACYCVVYPVLVSVCKKYTHPQHDSIFG